MDRKTNVWNISNPRKGGVDARDNATLKPGAKDSIPAVDNVLEPMSGDSQRSAFGKTGGMSITQK